MLLIVCDDCGEDVDAELEDACELASFDAELSEETAALDSEETDDAIDWEDSEATGATEAVEVLAVEGGSDVSPSPPQAVRQSSRQSRRAHPRTAFISIFSFLKHAIISRHIFVDMPRKTTYF